uniref:Uncharacterized protein n=1 Tax=Picea sitchensis TaxID=3332 RepID=A9NXB6_PICSI|nr:unknown [Picea sitchensis]
MFQAGYLRTRVLQQQRQPHQADDLFRDLGLLLFSILDCPISTNLSFVRTHLTPVGLTWLLFGIASALMLVGSVAFMIGIMMMPVVAIVAMVFSFMGVLDSISVAGFSRLWLLNNPQEWKRRRGGDISM